MFDRKLPEGQTGRPSLTRLFCVSRSTNTQSRSTFTRSSFMFISGGFKTETMCSGGTLVTDCCSEEPYFVFVLVSLDGNANIYRVTRANYYHLSLINRIQFFTLANLLQLKVFF